MMRQEIALNRAVLRVPVTATSSADALSPAELPVIQGDPGIPVLSIHGIGDLFVPFSMDQRYDELMVAHGQGRLFAGRAIREVTHCGYTTNELSAGFSALRSLRGRRPISAAGTARPAHSKPGPALVPRSTATWCRSTSNCAFLEAGERPDRTSHPHSRVKIR
jgi:hypothetical protein